ncbi:MAG: hypothetical protein LBD44_00560, partial [Spirochaetaceae bacterium]|nr:hypothetical protein [Spirochaetaceae bacterium]
MNKTAKNVSERGNMQSLGINIGSTSLKMVLFDSEKTDKNGGMVWSATVPHEGDFVAATRKLLIDGNVPLGTP